MASEFGKVRLGGADEEASRSLTQSPGREERAGGDTEQNNEDHKEDKEVLLAKEEKETKSQVSYYERKKRE